MTGKHCGNCKYCGEVLKDNLHSCNNNKSIFKVCLETATGCEKFEPQKSEEQPLSEELVEHYRKLVEHYDKQKEGKS